jgi:hypothetical protein
MIRNIVRRGINALLPAEHSLKQTALALARLDIGGQADQYIRCGCNVIATDE